MSAGQIDDLEKSISIRPSNLEGRLKLPPSKSHAMRWLILASMDSSPTEIKMNEIGRDVQAMIDCLSDMGLKYQEGIMFGGEFKFKTDKLDCKNSGTALRFLIGQVASCGQEITFDGDASLRVRTSLPLIESLKISSSTFGDYHLPMKIRGPVTSQNIKIDTSISSQFLSSILLMTPRTNGFELVTTGKSVSQKHSDLTWDLCKLTGAVKIGQPWAVRCPDVEIPPDPSMTAFCRLAGLDIENPPKSEDLIGHDLSNLNLKDSNDLITPLAAILALSDGGTITGAHHATFKESNRIKCTKKMLEQFSIHCNETADGLQIPGGQTPISPNQLVKTYGDHRIQMTAVILASKCGATIEGENLHEIAWPSFIQQLQNCGLIID